MSFKCRLKDIKDCERLGKRNDVQLDWDGMETWSEVGKEKDLEGNCLAWWRYRAHRSEKKTWDRTVKTMNSNIRALG